MSCPTLIKLHIGEELTLRASHINPLTKRGVDLIGAKVELLSDAFNKATANVVGGGADQIAISGTGSSEIAIYVRVVDTQALEVKSYPFKLWVTYPDGQRHVVDHGVINVSDGRTA